MRVCARTLGLVTSTAPPELPKRPETPKGTANDGVAARGRGYLVAAVVVVAVAVGAVLVAAQPIPRKIVRAGRHVAPARQGPPPRRSTPRAGSTRRRSRRRSSRARSSSTTSGRTRASTACARSRTSGRGSTATAPTGSSSSASTRPSSTSRRCTKNVEAAVKRDDVTWPVALDDDMTIWNEFENHYWPADYIADRTGQHPLHALRRRRLQQHRERDPHAARRAGDRRRGPTSRTCRRRRRARQQSRDVPRPAVPGPDAAVDRDPARHARLRRSPARRLAAPLLGPAGRSSLAPGKLEGALVGKWTAGDRGGHVRRDRRRRSCSACTRKEVNLVMATASGKPIDVVVELDGQPVPRPTRGLERARRRATAARS